MLGDLNRQAEELAGMIVDYASKYWYITLGIFLFLIGWLVYVIILAVFF